MAIRVQETASLRLDEIYRYTRNRRGETRGVVSRPVPPEFGVEGYFFRYERHFVYWRRLSNGDTGIVTVLHECMQQMARLKDDYFS